MNQPQSAASLVADSWVVFLLPSWIAPCPNPGPIPKDRIIKEDMPPRDSSVENHAFCYCISKQESHEEDKEENPNSPHR